MKTSSQLQQDQQRCKDQEKQEHDRMMALLVEATKRLQKWNPPRRKS